ncbi:MAG: retropepsin-like aspartic protease [Terracidiphilus sp.]
MSILNLKWLVVMTLAAASLSVVKAEPHCPGNVNSLPLRLVQRSQIIVPVTINHSGPFDFMVDTGAQVTTVDPALAAELHLKALGIAGVTGVGVYARASLTQLAWVDAGSHVVENVLAVIQNLGQTQLADHRVRGVLAGNFLEHFDLLIDYSHSIVCLDDSAEMGKKVKGERIPFSAQAGAQGSAPSPQKLIILARAPGIEKKTLHLQLDSGINSPLLYGAGEDLMPGQIAGAPLRSRGTDGVEHAFAVLVSQDVQVGPHSLRQVHFVMPMNAAKNSPKSDVDGLLPTMLFQRIYVNYADHYVVLESW